MKYSVSDVADRGGGRNVAQGKEGESVSMLLHSFQSFRYDHLWEPL